MLGQVIWFTIEDPVTATQELSSIPIIKLKPKGMPGKVLVIYIWEECWNYSRKTSKCCVLSAERFVLASARLL